MVPRSCLRVGDDAKAGSISGLTTTPGRSDSEVGPVVLLDQGVDDRRELGRRILVIDNKQPGGHGSKRDALPLRPGLGLPKPRTKERF